MIYREAIFSDCKQYRFLLTRKIDTGFFNTSEKNITFLMFNPSTADAEEDDPTIRRVIGFATREDCTNIKIVNLIPFITSKPSALNLNTAFGTGEYIFTLINTLVSSDKIVVAWGAIGEKYPDIFQTALKNIAQTMGRKKELLYSGKFFSLGTTVGEHPKHPLYIKADQPLKGFNLHLYLKRHHAYRQELIIEPVGIGGLPAFPHMQGVEE